MCTVPMILFVNFMCFMLGMCLQCWGAKLIATIFPSKLKYEDHQFDKPGVKK